MPPPGSPEALYLHVPFCRSRCRYCAFLSEPWEKGAARQYLRALSREPTLLSVETSAASTVFIGGGTPTVLPPEDLGQLLSIVSGLVRPSSVAEFTVEANPESLDAARLALLASAGVTRISLGVQSDDDRLLSFLGRPHDVAQAERAARLAARSGMDLSLDLIYGLPEQGPAEWRRTLRWAVGLGAGHLSAYALTVEEGTGLEASVASGDVVPPSDRDLSMLWDVAREVLSSAGFVHYEVSNFALPGRECRHNLAYWRYRPYLGLGTGAHSRLREGGSVISRENPATGSYLAALEAHPPRDPSVAVILSPGEVIDEILLMGLRTTEGVDPAGHPNASAALSRLRSSGLWSDLISRRLARDIPRLALTSRGMWLADGIAAESSAFLAQSAGP